MKKTIFCVCMLFCLFFVASGALDSGNSVHFDPLFDYYKGRSPASIASEFAVNDISGVYYFAVTPDACNKEIIDAFHERGIDVVLTLFPSWVYLSEADMDKYLPQNWRDWKMDFTNNAAKKNLIFISYVYPEYNNWYRNYVVDLLKKYNFEGVTMLETMYPCYNGFNYTPVLFGDVSEGFEKAFGEKLPEFLDASSQLYYEKNPELMERYLNFRTQSITDFYAYIMDGVREACPEVTIITWTLGISEPDGEAKIRYFNGSDTHSMVAKVQPDMHIVQTHWPDWMNPELKPDYVLEYKDFADSARRALPSVKVGFQGDCGSLPAMRRSPEWVRANLEISRRVFDNSVYYEFNIRDEVYSLPPEFKTLSSAGLTLTLAFDQRLGKESEQLMSSRFVNGKKIIAATVDGNLLILTFDAPFSTGETLIIPIGGVMDDPESRLPLSQHEPFPKGRVNIIPENTVISYKL